MEGGSTWGEWIHVSGLGTIMEGREHMGGMDTCQWTGDYYGGEGIHGGMDTCQWTGDYYGGEGVHGGNGYMSVDWGLLWRGGSTGGKWIHVSGFQRRHNFFSF